MAEVTGKGSTSNKPDSGDSPPKPAPQQQVTMTMLKGSDFGMGGTEPALTKAPPNFTGRGKFLDDDGNVYEGDYVNGKPHGKGKKTFTDGKVYEGDYDEGSESGKGKMTLLNGAVYEGDFMLGAPHGFGRSKEENGSVYHGGWSNGKKSGRCKYTFANGNVYEGNWEGEDANGKGKMTLKNGNVYEGDFVNGKPHGKGKATYPDGRVEKGKWKNGEFKGLFGFSSSSGSYGEPFGVILSIIISAVIAFISGTFLANFLYKFIPLNPDVLSIGLVAAVFIVCMITCRNHKGLKVVKLAVVLIGISAIGIIGAKATANKSPKPQTTETTQGANTNPSAEITKNVNFRKGPSTNDEVIRQLKQGDIVILTGEVSGGWTQITRDGEKGWVSNEYLKVWEK